MKKVYRFISVILALSMLALLTPTAAFAQVKTNIVCKSVSGMRGDTVTTSITINSGSQMQACSFELIYDSDVLELISATKGTALNSTPVINTGVLGKVIFSYASTSATISSGTILQVSFKIKPNARYGVSLITMKMNEFADGKFSAIPYDITNGAVTVVAPMLEAPDYIQLLDSGDTYLELMWAGNDDATGYNVYVNNILMNETPLSDNKIILEGLEQNSEYQIEVTAIHYTVESNKSEAYVFHTQKTQYDVIFVDWNYNIFDVIEGSVLLSTRVDHGSNAEAPANPTREGYTFIGWDQELTNVTSDMVVQAQYEIKTYTVRFVDEDGTVLKTETVEHGANATPPTAPTKEQYQFMGWNDSYESVTRDMDITALYKLDASIPMEGLSLVDGIEYVVVDLGETYYAVFEYYPENTTDTVTLTANNDNVEIDRLEIYPRAVGDTIITATATSGVTYEFTVHIRNATDIVVVTPPDKTVYKLGEELDLTGLMVQARYSDGSTETITDYEISGFDNTTIGNCTVEIEWVSAVNNTLSTSFDVTVVDSKREVTEIRIQSLPTKQEYNRKESLDLSGMVVVATFSDGLSEEITEYTVSGYNALKNGLQVITVTSNECTASFLVAVNQALVMGDVNQDGVLNTADVRTTLLMILGVEENMTNVQWLLCDVNNDNVVNTQDARRMLLTIAEQV